jgi:hypothetical protein
LRWKAAHCELGALMLFQSEKIYIKEQKADAATINFELKALLFNCR